MYTYVNLVHKCKEN